MADIRVTTGSRTPDRQTADKLQVKVRALRDGSLSVAQLAQVMAMEGRVFVVNAGSATAPITMGATSIDTTEPDVDLEVPAGTLVIPLYINVVMETFGTTLL